MPRALNVVFVFIVMAGLSGRVVCAVAGDVGDRSPDRATTISVGSVIVPWMAGASMGGRPQDAAEEIGGTLFLGGSFVGPSTGLVYGRCYGHAVLGSGLRFVSFGTALWSFGEVSDRGNGMAVAGSGAMLIFLGSMVYDLTRADDCTRRQNARRARSAKTSASREDEARETGRRASFSMAPAWVAGAPGIGVTARF